MATNAKTNKFSKFVKKNAALIVIVACVLAISGIIIAESVSSTGPTTRYPVLQGKEAGGIDPGPGPGPDPSVWMLPVAEYTIGMNFSLEEYEYSNTLREWFIHKGIDFITDDGANVHAAYDGVVQKITTDLLDGTRIVINHSDGIQTVYSSLAENVSVTVGQTVKSGDIIGKASDSAYCEFMDGAHVHFEMLQNGTHIDPRGYIEI